MLGCHSDTWYNNQHLTPAFVSYSVEASHSQHNNCFQHLLFSVVALDASVGVDQCRRTLWVRGKRCQWVQYCRGSEAFASRQTITGCFHLIWGNVISETVCSTIAVHIELYSRFSTTYFFPNYLHRAMEVIRWSRLFAFCRITQKLQNRFRWHLVGSSVMAQRRTD